ncbi:MAG: integrase arm-type DNA-binding domain-containing protein, partial [Geminicoccaceae bacterium]
MKLNQKIVDGLELPAGKNAIIFWDDECPGLGARLQGKARRWIVRYRVAGNPKQKQITLAPIAGMPLKKAREVAVEYTGAARRGIDRAANDQAEAEEADRLQRSRAEGRLGLIVDRYLQDAEKHLRASTFKETRRYLAVAWQPLHDEVVTELDTRAIISRLETIAADSGPVTANRARSALSQCLGWAVT